VYGVGYIRSNAEALYPVVYSTVASTSTYTMQHDISINSINFALTLKEYFQYPA